MENYTLDDWKADITEAQAIGIDGFALNCAPERIDSYTPKQLAFAYQAAEELDFKVFISFDFAYWTTGDTDSIIDIVGNYSSHPAQAYYGYDLLLLLLDHQEENANGHIVCQIALAILSSSHCHKLCVYDVSTPFNYKGLC